ncbi:hypothetical protein FA95DRAFT_1601514 [Auriscalpium vulgare]|uniref:Uncharacterized protein n=1 Tax=Auriscalpium vulgare TaxID=40419 RepID=A0ACB8S9G8_9AGAM|nr:hypothetical protein FA95DRAFT_1601514 [Auriscalpium vulgare]
MNKGSSPSTSGLADEETQKALALRAEKRAKNAQVKHEKAEVCKEEGNKLFKQGKYKDAIKKYEEASRIDAPRSFYLANIAAAYLKLESWDNAELYAQRALLQQPSFTKARYRRAIARKEKGELYAAIVDLEILLEQEPNCVEAQVELDKIQQRWERGEGELGGYESDDGYPQPDESRIELMSASDTTDFQHAGNGIPCRFYNHSGCVRGVACGFSHAPDQKSVRDALGKNVCLYFLIGDCKFGPVKCVYSHNRAFLTEGRWYDDDEKTMAARSIVHTQGTVDDPGLLPYLLGMLDKRIAWKFDSERALKWYAANRPGSGSQGKVNTGKNNGKGRGKGKGKGNGKGKGRGKGKGKGRGVIASGLRGAHQFTPYQGSSYDSYDELEDDLMEQRSNNMGFTDDQLEELLSQGVKPWDDDAWDVLEALSSL